MCLSLSCPVVPLRSLSLHRAPTRHVQIGDAQGPAPMFSAHATDPLREAKGSTDRLDINFASNSPSPFQTDDGFSDSFWTWLGFDFKRFERSGGLMNGKAGAAMKTVCVPLCSLTQCASAELVPPLCVYTSVGQSLSNAFSVFSPLLFESLCLQHCGRELEER